MSHITKNAKIIKVELCGLTVEIQGQGACNGCALKGRCGSGECKNQICSFPVKDTTSYHIGDTVELVISETDGFLAVFWGYILPLILIVTVLSMALYLNQSEIRSGIYGIIVLIPYYFGLSLFQKFFQKKLPVSINKRSEK